MRTTVSGGRSKPGLNPLLALTTLALRQMKQVWRIFTLIAIGMIATVLLVGAMPLFANVSTTASMRSTFANSGLDLSSAVQASIKIPDASAVNQTLQQLQHDYRQKGSPFFDLPPAVSIHIDSNPVSRSDKTAIPNLGLTVHGYDIGRIASHVHLLQGRLPQDQGITANTTLEIALTKENAAAIGARPGSTYTIYVTETIPPPATGGHSTIAALPLTLKVVGILQNLSPTAFEDPFWHGDELNYLPPALGDATPASDNVITSNSTLLKLFDHLGRTPTKILSGVYLSVYFPLNILKIRYDTINQLQTCLNYFTNQEPAQFRSTFIDNIGIDNTNLTSMNAAAKNLTTAMQLPMLTLVSLMAGLFLFFIVLMTELLVTRQAEAIALMRSRGATGQQIFLVFVVQSLLLGLLSVLLGSLLISPMIRILVITLFSTTAQTAINVLPTTPWGILLALGWSVWVAFLLIILTMSLAVWRTLSNSTLGRSTTSRTGRQRPLWQSFFADAVLLFLGLLIYGLYLYLTSMDIITAQLQVVLVAPCMVAAATLFCLGAVLLSLRLLSHLIQQGAKLAARRRGLVLMLSLALMARAPRQALRATLFLIFTIAFALFAQVLLATQAQRTVDLSNYVAPADFSGFLPVTNTFSGTFEQQEAAYRALPGVLSATVAYVGDESFQIPGSTVSLKVVATDPSSVSTSLNWLPSDDLTTIKAISGHLADQRRALTADLTQAQNDGFHGTLPPIPAIVSTSTKNLLHLSIGKRFFLTGVNTQETVPFIDSAEVPYLPGVSNISTDRGILVDYASFKASYSIVIAQTAPLFPTLAWLHTRQDSISLKRLQQTLSSGSLVLQPLIVHQMVLRTLQNDPLLITLSCMIAVGLGLALVLAWIACLVSAWSYVRTRLRSLLALRAFGCSPAQLTLLLSCEQVILYTAALFLGVGCGVVFTAFTLSDVVFSRLPLPDEITSVLAINLFQLQSSPPVHTIIPTTIVIGLGVVVLLCATGIGLTAMIVTRLSPAQMLRLSEDYVEEAPLPPAKQSVKVPSSHQEERTRKRSGLLHALELGRALTPYHRSWNTLGLTLIGVVLAILFVCVVPLFSQVAATAGVHDVLALPQNRMVVVTNNSLDMIPLGQVQTAFTQGTRTLNAVLSGPQGSYFHTAPITTVSMAHIENTTKGSLPSSPAAAFASISARALADQVRILQGHLPQQDTMLQILLTSEAAHYLHVRVGDVLTKAHGYPLDMKLVGVFQPDNDVSALLPPATDFFYYADPQKPTSGIVTFLTSTEGLIHALDASGSVQSQNGFVLRGTVTWNYPIDETVTSLQLNSLITTLSSLNLPPWIGHTGTFTFSTITTPIDALKEYQQSIIVSSIPIFCISFLIIALLLLFLNFMGGLLVEQEASTIAFLRSRGATQRQIFAAFFQRALLINGIGWLAGIGLAIPVILVLTRLTLQSQDQIGLLLLANNPWQTFWTLIGCASLGIGITGCAMGLILLRATQTNYLSLRREAARETRKPLWQRWYLDVISLVIALSAYEFVQYLTSSDLSDPAVAVLIKSPLVLAATLFLVLACLLVLLRAFPLLLLLGSMLAQRNRGSEAMLALSQMAHAPRQPLRMALLLLLSTAFVVFAVIFSASQTQHITDTARYWTGADFSGSLPHALTPKKAGVAHNTYQHISGVTSVALGDLETVQVNNGNQDMQLLAIDPAQFLSTVTWPALKTPAQQKILIDQLKNPQHFPALKQAWLVSPGNAVPAVIDTISAQELQVQPGQTFTVDSSGGPLFIFVVAEVSGMPVTNILVGYDTYSFIYQENSIDFNTNDSLINSIWLKTDGREQSLQHARQVLEFGPLQLSTFYDQQATLQDLASNPLNRNLVGILVVGTVAPLLLTWIGCLMASLIEMRRRQLHLGVLRALGSTPIQLMKVIGWEQVLIFGTSVVLGTLAGLLTASLTLPSLVLTAVLPKSIIAGGGTLANGVQDLFSWQNTPAVHIMIPPVVGLIVVVLIALALLVIIFMTRAISGIALAQALRLNED